MVSEMNHSFIHVVSSNESFSCSFSWYDVAFSKVEYLVAVTTHACGRIQLNKYAQEKSNETLGDPIVVRSHT